MNSLQIIFTLLSPEDFLFGIEKGFDLPQSCKLLKNYTKLLIEKSCSTKYIKCVVKLLRT